MTSSGYKSSLEEQIETAAFSVFGLVISFTYVEIIFISQSTIVKIFLQVIFSFEHFRISFETKHSTGFPSKAISKHVNYTKVFVWKQPAWAYQGQMSSLLLTMRSLVPRTRTGQWMLLDLWKVLPYRYCNQRDKDRISNNR